MSVIGCSLCGRMGYCERHMGKLSDSHRDPYVVTFTVEVQADNNLSAEQLARALIGSRTLDEMYHNVPQRGVSISVEKK